MSVRCYLSLGSNQGNRKRNIEKALDYLHQHKGISGLKSSSLYITQPQLRVNQPSFLNMVVCLSTTLPPLSLLTVLKGIEKECGRQKGIRWGPRPIDLDILLYGQRRMNHPRLILPHPRYYQRRFVLIPLCELAPKGVHPVFRIPHQTLMDRLTSRGQRVTIYKRWKKSRFYPSSRKRNKKSPSQR